MVYKLVNTSCLSCSTNTHEHRSAEQFINENNLSPVCPGNINISSTFAHSFGQYHHFRWWSVTENNGHINTLFSGSPGGPRPPFYVFKTKCRLSGDQQLKSTVEVRPRCGSHQVLLQSGHRLLEDAVVMFLETHQLREAGHKKPCRDEWGVSPCWPYATLDLYFSDLTSRTLSVSLFV